MSKKDIVYELHRNVRKKFKRKKFQMRGMDDTFQADLIDMIKYEKYNRKYKYILAVIDTFSKYTWCLPLRTKTADEVALTMNKIFTSSGRKPKNLIS